jgi:preflagellin peptidase FlaK
LDPVLTSEYLSVAVTLIFLTIAAYSDLKTREVSDKVWAVYAPIGAALTVFRTYLQPSLLILTVASIALSILIGFGLVFFGLGGGADGKAVMCLGLALPLPPGVVTPILGFFHPFFPIVVLIVAYICSLSVAFWMLARNLLLIISGHSRMFEGLENEPTGKKALALLTGYRTSVQRLRSTFYLYPMEKVVEDENGAHLALQLYANPDVDRDKEVAEFLESLQKVGSPATVWVTPGLPLLLFVLVAVVVVLILGDPLFALIALLLPH